MNEATRSGLRRLYAFTADVLNRFAAHGCGTMAASLAYTTLLSLVPLLTMIFLALSISPWLQPLRADLERFLFTQFVPEVGETVQAMLQVFTDKAAHLGIYGFSFLSITIILLLIEIDGALVRIWGPKPFRRRLRNYLLYGGMLVFGPLLLAANLAVTSFLLTLPLLAVLQSSIALHDLMLGVLSFLTATVAFALVYWLVPHWPVPTRAALTGALAAATLFEIAKRLFAWYVQHVSLQEAIYGAFAAVPLFLLWIYFSWAIVLFGAEVTHALAAPRRAREPVIGPEER